MADAESYTVNVVGPDMSWQINIGAEHTELTYPEAQPSLAAGNAYEVIVVANRPQEPIIASRVVNIRDEVNEIISFLLEQIESSRIDD